MVVISLIAVTAFYTNEIVAPNPVIKGHVGRVMLAKAMDRVDASIGSKGDARHLSCTSKSDRKIFCNAIGRGVYHVSFATDVVAPAFELTGQRTIEGKLYVNAFNRDARDALEHYRTAAKEQREQEQRRHEHQVHGLQTELKQAQLAFSLKQEELTRLNKEAAVLATELGSVNQALHLEREASRNQAKKVEQLQAVEARAAVLDAQLVDSRTRLAEAGETAVRADIASDELRRQIYALEVELSAAKSAIALEERLAKLDKAVFGGEPTSRLNALSGSE